MTLNPQAVDLFAKSLPAGVGGAAVAALQPKQQAVVTYTMGGVLSEVMRDNPSVRSRMTLAEQTAVDAVIKNVGTPDEYGTAVEYILRAVPYVRSVYAAMDTIQPIMPTNEEISILMRSRFISA
jgi:hypothetical protein